jgi:DnaK suppressor protein
MTSQMSGSAVGSFGAIAQPAIEATGQEYKMTKAETQRHREMLETKKAELSLGLRNRDRIAVEKTADTLDAVQFAGERELAIRNLDRESRLLRATRVALARIDGGSYGVCLRCDQPINPKRLSAVPWAAYCIRCQEEADRFEAESQMQEDTSDLSAA